MYIASQAELEAFIERASSSDILAIDTEFLREKSYYPKLCLIQMATRDERVIIDPFAVEDVKAIARLLDNADIVKVFHAGYQDLEIMYFDIGTLPRPIFDTQVAASLLGQGQQIGYAALVHSICGVKLRKVDSFTDWSARPLAESQLLYAEQDVNYLPAMYDSMVASLKEKGRLSWLDSEFEAMVDPAHYDIDERTRFTKLKHVGQLNRRQMAAAREMAAWREIEARKRNVPRKWVLTDEQIVESCKREPRTIDDLFMIRGIRERLTTRDARDVIALVVAALDSSPEAWPELSQANRPEHNVDSQVDLLMAIVRLRARENGIAVPTLAGHADLVALARGHYDESELSRGWRRDIVGAELIDLVEGRLALSIKDGHVRISKCG